MPRSRAELEEQERKTLAPYAQFSADTRGRQHKEAPPEWRTHYQRDRDRVIHSRAFRRLEYKTQVFLNGSGDHLRTRLTHTIEVAAISRNISRALRLNEDLCEAIALAHDLGHSPFGHRGETALSKLMKVHGGFEHNRQSLRVVEDLEQKYPNFAGLNLTWEVREGLVKHYTAFDHPSKRKDFDAKSSSLEAQVANLADEITLWNLAARTVEREYGQLPDECRRYFTIRCIIDAQVKDVVETSEERIQARGVQSADEVRLHPKALLAHSPRRKKENLELRAYLYKNLYSNPEVHGPNMRAVQMLEHLFKYFLEHPKEIGPLSRKRIRKVGLHRAVCDYLAGMTDRYAIAEYERLFGVRI